MPTDDGYYRIGADIKEAMAFFDGLRVNRKTIQKNLLRGVGVGARQAVRQNMGHYLQRRTGTLYRSVTSKVSMSGKSVVISNTAVSSKATSSDGRLARYGFMLASGYTIEAKTSRGLTFNIDGKWVTRHAVTVRPIDWMEPSVDRYVASAECSRRLDKALQKQIDYWEKRIRGGRT